jgi:hypothetical protein
MPSPETHRAPQSAHRFIRYHSECVSLHVRMYVYIYPLQANPWIARLWLPSCVLDFGLHSGRRVKTKKSHIRHGPRALLALPTKYLTATFVDFLHGVQLCVQANVLYRHTDVYYYYTCLICFFSCSFTLIGLVISSWRLYTQKMNG